EKLVGREWACSADLFPQRLALHQLHHDEGLPVLLFNTVNGADVRVIESRSCSRFSLKSLQGAYIVAKRFRQELQCHAATQPQVFRRVHHSHPSSTKLSQNAIM